MRMQTIAQTRAINPTKGFVLVIGLSLLLYTLALYYEVIRLPQFNLSLDDNHRVVAELTPQWSGGPSCPGYPPTEHDFYIVTYIERGTTDFERVATYRPVLVVPLGR